MRRTDYPAMGGNQLVTESQAHKWVQAGLDRHRLLSQRKKNVEKGVSFSVFITKFERFFWQETWKLLPKQAFNFTNTQATLKTFIAFIKSSSNTRNTANCKLNQIDTTSSMRRLKSTTYGLLWKTIRSYGNSFDPFCQIDFFYSVVTSQNIWDKTTWSTYTLIADATAWSH